MSEDVLEEFRDGERTLADVALHFAGLPYEDAVAGLAVARRGRLLSACELGAVQATVERLRTARRGTPGAVPGQPDPLDG